MLTSGLGSDGSGGSSSSKLLALERRAEKLPTLNTSRVCLFQQLLRPSKTLSLGGFNFPEHMGHLESLSQILGKSCTGLARKVSWSAVS